MELNNCTGIVCALHTALQENSLLPKKNRESTKPRLVNDTMTTLSLGGIKKNKILWWLRCFYFIGDLAIPKFLFFSNKKKRKKNIIFFFLFHNS
jgi:hypothetical protein